MSDDPFRAPTDAEIDAAERRLDFVFHPDYRAFLKSGGDVGEAVLEAAVILPDPEITTCSRSPSRHGA